MPNFRGPIAGLVGGAVNLTKDYKAKQKAKETAAATDASAAGPRHDAAPPAQQQHPEHDSSRDSSIDAQQWALDLDEAQQECNATSRAADGQRPPSGGDKVKADAVLKNLAARPVTLSNNTPHRLELPVILPQRRPGAQHRGFVHAYAPMLGECDVDEAAWMEFLAGLDATINANPWFHAVNAATGVAGMAHSAASAGFSAIGFLAGLAVSAGLEVGRKGYVQYRQNGYLDRANEVYFKPRGLYCFFVAYRPAAGADADNVYPVAEIDLQTNAARAIQQRDAQGTWKKMTSAAAITARGDAEIPASAPLVFPQLDAMDEKQKENAFKRYGGTLINYFDKRAVDKFDGKNPGNKLANGQAPVPANQDAPGEGDGSAPKPEKKSRFNGPVARAYENHKERRSQRKEKKEDKSSQRPLKKMMTEDVMYLMVTNLPTQEELDRLVEEMLADMAK